MKENSLTPRARKRLTSVLIFSFPEGNAKLWLQLASQSPPRSGSEKLRGLSGLTVATIFPRAHHLNSQQFFEKPFH